MYYNLKEKIVTLETQICGLEDQAEEISQASEKKVYIEIEIRREKIRNKEDPVRRNRQIKEKVKETIIMQQRFL